MNKIPDSIIRIAICFAALLVLVIIARVIIIPVELTDSDIYLASAIEREMAHELSYAGSETCTDCHDEYFEMKAEGHHKKLSCEVCHGAGLEHTMEPDEFTPSAPRDRKFCPVCHTYNPSRPTGFPQINPYAHNPLSPCISCHNPHDPTPPETPSECSACHANIARTLAVSPHVRLECVTCHVTPEKHKSQPRSFRPEKPENREFCAQCHAKGSESLNAPKIDVATHGNNGEKYLCWQCHYPHLPEVD